MYRYVSCKNHLVLHLHFIVREIKFSLRVGGKNIYIYIFFPSFSLRAQHEKYERMVN